MISKQQLLQLFAPLHQEASALANAVLGNGQPVGLHPCSYLVRDAYHHPSDPLPPGWPGTWSKHWHLPEPFIGNLVDSDPSILFVGTNPSIDHLEQCPVHGDAADKWLDFWVDAFDSNGCLKIARSPIPLYEYYKRLLLLTLGTSACLGVDAIVTELVRYKAKTPHGDVSMAPRPVAHRFPGAIRAKTGLPLTLAIIDTLCDQHEAHGTALVVVLVGGYALQHLGGHFVPALARAKLGAVTGQVFAPSPRLKLVPSKHTNGWPSTAERLQVAQALATALGRPKPSAWP